ncbi:hypothetical protein CLOSTMETH_01304 [[Clostridium] methylpentosum DSM 5476]|uniref:Uncharacterized protein n=1 Tax=[Clostridium] methylpentosum DSM 5476 TaxID=537013 RepID=C0EBT6_9FIRM|nr:hypothetical protein CLOSTMETH_01304 [[Clostridium] methylpentosum DSM 5476]
MTARTFLFICTCPPPCGGAPQPESAGHALRFSVKAGIAVIPDGGLTA